MGEIFMYDCFASQKVNESYEGAKEVYASLGINAEDVLKKLKKIQVSLHCWQGDDVTGFEVGADGINFDTTASAGDAEFLATLQAVEELSATTDLSIEVGMAAELVLGFHGEIEYNGQRLAGMWPHEQLKVVEEAGASTFGPVVNTNTGKSSPWNLSRAVTFVKECSNVATIPIHANVGIGVGGVPMNEIPPADILTRASAAMVEIGRVDGL
jgi:dimethylamine--corrinoid protein Co-methyltransferase